MAIIKQRIGCLLVACTLAAALLVGCDSKSKVERLAVSGKVTFNGQPVPSGVIYFSPNPRKGNRGPQGVARIVDGVYSTEHNGKGSVQGPQIVEIRGFQVNATPHGDVMPNASGPPMFPPYMTEVDIQDSLSDLDFDIPAEHAR